MDPRVTELHNIMPMANAVSVLERGILSYEAAAKLPHTSVALAEVQERRDSKRIPGGRGLHQYANLYFHARNPMMYRRLAEVNDLCILRIAVAVLELPDTVLSDQNAASDYVRFLAPHQSGAIDFDAVFAEDWNHPDRATYLRRKSRKCAEVLVPDRVPPDFVMGAYVVDEAAKSKLLGLGFSRPVCVEPVLFFRQAGA